MRRTSVPKKPKQSYIFRVVIEPDEDVYHAYCPALKGCHSWGHTYEEALKNIQEAVQCHVGALLQAGDPIPTEPSSDVEVKPVLAVAVHI
ncbi:MAG: type II toxin-antitoxin system HicB family antitoxin [Candidatus Bipolaricaulia bacterium]